MGRELTPHELRELLGAYALDAVDGDEREQLETWLARTPEAQEELAALRETAALLAYSDEEAPRAVWSRIEESLADVPPPLALPARPRRLALRVPAALAAASAAAAALTAVVLSDEMSEQEDRLEAVARSLERDGMRQAATAAAADPEARTLRLGSPDGSSATVVTMPDGEGYVMAEHLPRLRPGRTYQLWIMTGTGDEPRMVSAGVLGRAFSIAAFHAPRDARGFALTDEQAPGRASPHGPHVLEGTFP